MKQELFSKNVKENIETLKNLHWDFTEYDSFIPENYQPAFERKMKFFDPILKGEATILLDFSNEDDSELSVQMYEEIIRILKSYNYLLRKGWGEEGIKKYYSTDEERKPYIINDVFYYSGEKLAEFLENNISSEDVKNNRTSVSIRIGKRRYGVGAKVTRVLSAMMDLYNLNIIKNTYVGNLKPNPTDKKVLLTTHPIAGYLAGMIGDSCLSPHGSNKHAGPLSNGYKNTAVFFNESLSWRAFVSVDFENKYFALAKGYPRENYSLQFFIKRYFEKQGFKMVKGYFEYPEYFDMTPLFINEKEDNKRQETHEWNKDAFHWYSANERVTLTGSETLDVIAEVFYDDWEDIHDFGPEFESRNMRWSDYEEEEYHADDCYYSEFIESYIGDYGEESFHRRNYDTIENAFLSLIKEIGVDFDSIADDYDDLLEMMPYYLLRDDFWEIKYHFNEMLKPLIEDEAKREEKSREYAARMFTDVQDLGWS